MAIEAGVTHLGDLLNPPVGSRIEATLGGPGVTKFMIPAYQRPYDWTGRHFEQFVGDSGLANHLERAGGVATDYFIGHVVIYRNAPDPTPDVVDGQQRITALNIIISALRDECFRNSKYESGWQLHNTLISQGPDFKFESSAWQGGINDTDSQLMALIQSIPSNAEREPGIGTFRRYPQELEFEITMLTNWNSPAGGGGLNADIASSSGGINFPLIEGTQLDFGVGYPATITGPIPGDIAVSAQNTFPLINPISITCPVNIPAGSVATVSLGANGGVRTDQELDAIWAAEPVPRGIGNVNMNRKFWAHYKMAVEQIRSSLLIGGITLEAWRDLLLNNIRLTVAVSDSNREAQEYFALINDDRFKKSLTLSNIWRAEVISKITSEAERDIAVINGGAGAPVADPFGIDDGTGPGYLTGLSGTVHASLLEIRNRLQLPPRQGRDRMKLVGEFLENFVLSCGTRASGTKSLDELEKLEQYIYETNVAGIGIPLSSGIPGVVPPPPGRAIFMPEDTGNADIRLHWLAYKEMMDELNSKSQTYRQIMMPEAGDPFATRLKNLERTSHKQYIPLLLAGLSKIEKSSTLAGVVRAGPGAPAAAIAAWSDFDAEEQRLLGMIEYLVVRGTILPAPNDGALSSGAIYAEMEKWCAAIDQTPDNIADIRNTLQYISGRLPSPALPAIGGGGTPTTNAIASPLAVPVLGGGGSVGYERGHVRIRRKSRWSREVGGALKTLENISFRTIFGLCNTRKWSTAAGTIDPDFWTSSDYVYEKAADCRLLLWRIEEHLRETVVGAAVAGDLELDIQTDQDVEHILPKTLTPAWVAALGVGIQQTDWLDRLGNKGLYESAANVAISNSSFADKQMHALSGYNNTTGRWLHMHDLTNPKTASPLLTPGDPNEAPHNTAVAPPGTGIYGSTWGPAQIEIRGEWLFGILWEIFNSIP